MQGAFEAKLQAAVGKLEGEYRAALKRAKEDAAASEARAKDAEAAAAQSAQRENELLERAEEAKASAAVARQQQQRSDRAAQRLVRELEELKREAAAKVDSIEISASMSAERARNAKVSADLLASKVAKAHKAELARLRAKREAEIDEINRRIRLTLSKKQDDIARLTKQVREGSAWESELENLLDGGGGDTAGRGVIGTSQQHTRRRRVGK